MYLARAFVAALADRVQHPQLTPGDSMTAPV